MGKLSEDIEEGVIAIYAGQRIGDTHEFDNWRARAVALEQALATVERMVAWLADKCVVLAEASDRWDHEPTSEEFVEAAREATKEAAPDEQAE